jgi:ApeA N-terminal domain 1
MSSGNVDYRGLWWSPSNPSDKVQGKLVTHSNNEAILILQNTTISIRETTYHPIMLGLSNTGEKITLIDSRLSRPENPLSFVFFQTSFVIGAHFQSKEEIRFKTLEIWYSYLDVWIKESNLDVQITTEIDGYKVTIAQVLPNEKQTPDEAGQNFFMPPKPLVTFSSLENERNLEDFWRFAYQFQTLVSLAMGSSVYPMEVKGVTENGITVSIHYLLPKWMMETQVGIWDRMLFPLSMVEEKLGEYLSNWFKKSELLRPVYELFFSTLYNPHLYLEGQFLNYVQALEAYHRRCGRFGGKYQSDEDYKTLYEKFVAIIPQELSDDFKTSLKKGKLKYANEYSLRKRLKDLIMEILGEGNIPLTPFIIELDETQSQDTPVDFLEKGVIDMSPFRFFKPKPNYKTDKGKLNQFIEEVCDYRNYLAHSSEELETKKVGGYQLIDITEQLKIVLEVCLLREIGFDSDSIYKIINRQSHLLL